MTVILNTEPDPAYVRGEKNMSHYFAYLMVVIVVVIVTLLL